MTTEMTNETPQPAAPMDVVSEVQKVLARSEEPLIVSKILAQLPAPLRKMDAKELAEVLERQVAANVLYQYPRYRSQQDRYWDRPMPVHIVYLMRAALEETPMPWSELRRKIPAYAQTQAEEVFQQELAQGRLYRYPRLGSRGRERIGVRPPDPREYLRHELVGVFQRLEELGFNRAKVRQAGLELLHEEEWDSPPASKEQSQGAAEAGESQLEASQTDERPAQEHAAVSQPPAAISQAATHPDAPDVSQMS